MDINTAKQKVEEALASVIKTNTALLAIRSSLNTAVNSGRVLWVNVYQKGVDYHAGNMLFGTREAAQGWRGPSSRNPNAYVGAFPVDLGGDSSTPSAPIERQFTSLADKDYDEQQALWLAAKLFYADQPKSSNNAFSPKIQTIKFIRTITQANLLESKQLVDYVIDGSNRPVWMKITRY